MRLCGVFLRPVLLPRRPEALHRPRLLLGAEGAVRCPGDFAQAYVITHEIGHHVQHILGIDQAVRQKQAADPRHENAYSVALELQADCFAGVWGHETAQRGILEKGDVEEGLNAAAAIGDDRLQRAAGRRVSPDAFTHGSSEQRVTWFRKGLQTGDMKACDTFRATR